MDNKLRLIFNYFGYGPQQLKLVEESGELLIAIAKNNSTNFLSEMADVMCVIRQFDVAHNGLITEIMESKVERTIERIEQGYYKGARKNAGNKVLEKRY